MKARQDDTVRLVILSGFPGSGKSTVAEAIGRALHTPVVSVDPIEAAIVEAGIARSFETGLAAYLVAQALADGHLAAGLGVVIDATNYVNEGRELWRELARRHGITMDVIRCVAPDPTTLLDRLARRDRGLAIPEPTAADVETQAREWVDWPEPHLVLEAMEPARVNILRALAYLGARSE